MTSNFTLLDWGIVSVYVAGTVVIGLYANRHIRSMADYVVAGRALKSSLSIATMLGSEIGLVTVMYMAQKGYTGGFAAFHIGLAGGVTCLIVGLTGFIVVPLRKHGVMTIPEFYGKRWGRGVRILGGSILAIAGVLNMGAFLKVGAIFVTSLTGIQDPNAVNIVMAILLTLVLIYTILGGMVSVVITDYIQFVVLAIGMLIACYLAVREVGWGEVVETVRSIHGPSGFNPFYTDGSGGFGWEYVIWMVLVFGLWTCAVWPTAVMRVCSAKDTDVVRRLYTWSSIGFLTRCVIPMFLGTCALAYLWRTLGAESQFFDGDGRPIPAMSLQALPVFLSQILPVGVIGLVAAGMLAAFMSTHDSYLLCWASVIVEDVINPLSGGSLPTRTRLLMARVLILVTGGFLLAFGIFYPFREDVLDFLAVSGAIYLIGAFSLLLFGLYWKGASTVGAYLALITGTLAVLGLEPIRVNVGLTEENLGFDVSEVHIGLTTTVVALVLMVVGSLLFPDRDTVVDEHAENRSS